MNLITPSRFIAALALTAFAATPLASAKTPNAKRQAAQLKKQEGSYYSPASLSGKFASWGIDPFYKNASINLQESWKKFKKTKDVVVVVVDTGIQPDHPFLKD